MRKGISYSSITIVVLSLAIVLMSVGFATLFSQNITINGTATVKKSIWKVNLDTTSYSESTGSVSVAAANRSIANTSMTYTVTLSKPGDFYEFTIDVENGGTFDADLTSITMSSVSDRSDYLSYKVSYGSSEYTSSQSSITGKTLTAGSSETVKVRVEYLTPSDSTKLPSTDQTNISLNLTLGFTQSAS